MLHVAHEGLDCRQPRIARAGSIAALLLQMLEERHHELRVDLLQSQGGRPHSQPLAGELEEELKSEGVGIAGMRACAPFDGQALAQESSDVRCDRGHGVPPCRWKRQASATPVMSWGVTCRYQYVSETRV
jgi:hypothetical protein